MTTPHPYDALLIEAAGLRSRVAELEAENALARNAFEAQKAVLRGAVKDLESELARLRGAQAPKRVRMDPQPVPYEEGVLPPLWWALLDSPKGNPWPLYWFPSCPSDRGWRFVRDPDGVWYWELPAQEGGKP